MRILFVIIVALIFTACSSQKYYVVRHAEKATEVMSGDPPLSKEGMAQARDIEMFLHNQKIRQVYSTRFQRTVATAKPLADILELDVNFYDAGKEKDLTRQLLSNSKDNMLIVGHSNTVDDLVNGLMQAQTMTDVPDSTYKVFYLVTRKGKKLSFKRLPIPMMAPR